MIDGIIYSEPIGKSDHLVMEWDLACYVAPIATRVVKYQFDKANFNDMRATLATVNWNDILAGESIDDQWASLSSKIKSITDVFVPHSSSRLSTFKNRQHRKPLWMNERVLASLKKKKAAFEQYKQSRAGQDCLAYTKARNHAKAETRRAVREFEKEIALQAKKNPKAFYKYVNSKVKTRGSIGNLISDRGEILSDDSKKAQAFNDFFASAFTREDLQNVPAVDVRNPVSFLSSIVISEDDVRKVLKNLQPDKSPGPDNIHPRILKECANELAVPLTTLFRNTMELSKLPREWKDANVTPVYKKGPKSSANNYRPISLTSVCCKVLEKLIRDAVLDHMLQNKFLSDKQHGFVHGRSCTTQLLKVIDLWTEILDQGGAIDSVYLDFAKAFDSVPHERLLVKLASYGIGGHVLQWIRQFLTGRRQRVAVAGDFSTWIEVLSGVPQGSVLGPTLFVCFINDMPDVVESFVYMHADDSKIFRKVNFVYEAESLQRDLDSLQDWESKWQLRFNVDKCKVMHLGGNRNSHAKYFMKGSVQETVEEKDLGVWISNDLKFSTHVAKSVNKANQVLGLIRRSFTYLDCPLMRLLFTALVRPHLEYANMSFGTLSCRRTFRCLRRFNTEQLEWFLDWQSYNMRTD